MVQNLDEEWINNIDDDDTSSSMNRYFSITTRHKNRKISENFSSGMVEITSYRLRKSLRNQLMTDWIVQGNKNHNDIAIELQGVGLSIATQLDTLMVILEKLEYIMTFNTNYSLAAFLKGS